MSKVFYDLRFSANPQQRHRSGRRSSSKLPLNGWASRMSRLLEAVTGMFRYTAKFAARLGESGFNAALARSVTIDGQNLWTLQQAAYALRQYSINHDDYNGWRISQLLRDADGPLRAQLAETKLRAWIRSQK